MCVGKCIFGNDIFRDARGMARQVYQTIIKLVSMHGKLTDAEATQKVNEMFSQKRYHLDVWS
jgi:sulfite reductase alpha subunit-like flavoprotein